MTRTADRSVTEMIGLSAIIMRWIRHTHSFTENENVKGNRRKNRTYSYFETSERTRKQASLGVSLLRSKTHRLLWLSLQLCVSVALLFSNDWKNLTNDHWLSREREKEIPLSNLQEKLSNVMQSTHHALRSVYFDFNYSFLLVRFWWKKIDHWLSIVIALDPLIEWVTNAIILLIDSDLKE